MSEHKALSLKYHDVPLFEVDEEGDVIVPDAPDEFGWHPETSVFNYQPSNDDLLLEAQAARNIMEDEHEEYQERLERPKTLREKMITLQEHNHFMALSRAELSDAMTLAAHAYMGGAATFLNTVLLRQKDVLKVSKVIGKPVDESMPKRSVFSIVARYEDHAKQAKTCRRLLKGFADMVAERGVDPKELAGNISILSNWTDDGSTRTPMLALLKADDIDAYIQKESSHDPYKVNYSELSGNRLRGVGRQYLDALTVGQLQDIITHRMDELTSREAFWENALREARSHNVARPAATAALGMLIDEEEFYGAEDGLEEAVAPRELDMRERAANDHRD